MGSANPTPRPRTTKTSRALLIGAVTVAAAGAALYPLWHSTPASPTVPGTAAPATATPRQEPSSSRAVASPPGIFFDDFHYNSANDPALSDHGWIIRSGAGGPGIPDTWSASGVSFPSTPGAQGGQALQLEAKTNGTRKGTSQAEVQSGIKYFTGTCAARIYYSDAPTSGRNGDHINESFYAISPNNARYSELDTEYMPNGGWGAPGPELDTTSWHSAVAGDRVTRKLPLRIQGWHTVVITAEHNVVTYYLDGRKLFSSDGKYFPREGMAVNFNAWFVDLPQLGSRTWDMRVNWLYVNANQAMSLPQVQKAVGGYVDNGTNYINTTAGQQQG
jgi:hypothetical protein